MMTESDLLAMIAAAEERVASYLWTPGPGYTREDIEQLRTPRSKPQPPAPAAAPAACRGTRYLPQDEE